MKGRTIEKANERLREAQTAVRKRIRHTKVNIAIVAFGILLIILTLLTHAAESGGLVMPPDLLSALRFFTTVTIAYLVASLVIRLTVPFVDKTFEESVEVEQKLLLSKAYGFFVYLIATLFVLWRLGVTLANITLFFGLAATGIAFAVRDVITAYFAWYMLLTKRPFRIGDHIRIGDDEGRVQHIGTFYVILEDTPERYEDYVRVPNRLFLERSIQNFGRESFLYKVRVPVGAIKDFPKGMEKRLETVPAAVRRACGEDLRVLLDVDKERVFVEVRGYAKSYPERDATRDKVIRTVLRHVRA